MEGHDWRDVFKARVVEAKCNQRLSLWVYLNTFYNGDINRYLISQWTGLGHGKPVVTVDAERQAALQRQEQED